MERLGSLADSFFDSYIFHSWNELLGLPDKTQVSGFVAG
jgi:hypothetical protein